MATVEQTLTWQDLRARVLARDGRHCTVGWLLGGRCSDTLHVHHLVPREEGGTNDLDNLVSVCGRHHPMAEAVRREVIHRRGWRRCPHGPGVHRYPGARAACERNLNRDMLIA